MAIGTGTMLALAAGTALGAKKGYDNKQATKRDRFIRSQMIANSPWTGMKDPGEMQRPGMTDSLLQGALAGAMLGQGIQGLTTSPNAGASALLKNAGPQTMSSALGQDVLQKQFLSNPYMQGGNAWGGMLA